jgi:hypothetical protein
MALGKAPDARLMHLLSGARESSIELSGAEAPLEKIVALDFYLRAPLAATLRHVALDSTGLGDLELQILAEALASADGGAAGALTPGRRGPAARALVSLSLRSNRLTFGMLLLFVCLFTSLIHCCCCCC